MAGKVRLKHWHKEVLLCRCHQGISVEVEPLRGLDQAGAVENYLSGLGAVYPYFMLDDVTFLAVVIGSVLCTLKRIVRHDPALVRLPIFDILFSDHHINHHRFFNCNYGSWWLDHIHGTTYARMSS